jgi:hypothetical protein
VFSYSFHCFLGLVFGSEEDGLGRDDWYRSFSIVM